MMTPVTKQSPRPIPATPKAASRRRAPLDRALAAAAETGLFRALADPTRCRLFACLAKCARPCSVTELAACCDVDFSVVNRHLATLERAGAVESEKRGRTVWYVARSADLAGTFGAMAETLRASGDAASACCPPGEGAGCRPGECGPSGADAAAAKSVKRGDA